MIDAWMRLYPQLNVHTEYRGRTFLNTQVTYLMLQCPENGSIHALIENYFQAMDALHHSVPVETRYEEPWIGSPAIWPPRASRVSC